VLVIAILLSAAAVARTGWAQPSAMDTAEARQLYNQGIRLRDGGDNAGALEKLKGAHALGHTPITGLELGRTFAALGRLVDARETFLEVARIPVRSEETPRSTSARAQSADLAEKLRGRIPSLTVKITGIPAGEVAVTIDDSAVPADVLDAPRLLDPGKHEVRAHSTSGGKAESTVDLKEGEEREIELKLVLDAGVAPAPARASEAHEATPVQTDAAPGVRRDAWPGVLLVSGGAAVAIAGVALMGVEISSASNANTTGDRSAYDRATAGWKGGLVGAVVGGAAMAGGGIWLVTRGRASSGTGTGSSVWVGAGVGTVRLGGSW
jgi:hypothetical protein